MNRRNERLAVLPRQVVTEVLTRAVSWAGWIVAVFIIAMQIPLLIDVLRLGVGLEHVPLPLASTIGILLLLGYAAWRPSLHARVLYLVVGAAFAFIFELSLVLADPTLAGSATYLLNRPAGVLVLLVPGIVRPLAALRWAVLSFVVAMSTLVAVDLIAGNPIVTGTGPLISLIIAASALTAIMSVRWRAERHPLDLERLQNETTQLELEHQYEHRAAAIIHDTVLSDLTTVMNSDGAIDTRTRARFNSDVETLENGSWLRESRELLALDATDTELRNGMVALVSDMQWRGLTVDITGNPEDEVVRLNGEQITAVHGAVRASLENVLQHSGTDFAEVVFGVTHSEATVMVIDQGRGFDFDAVPADRLGLRASIIARIEEHGGTVRVWSKLEHGTSIMITMPADIYTRDSDAPGS